MKRPPLFLSLLLGVSTLFAQSSVWKIQGEDTTLYIGGTVHILRAEDFPLPEEFDQAYAASETLVFEVDGKEMEDPETMQLMMTKLMMEGDPLEKVLSEKVLKDTVAYFNQYGIPEHMVRTMKPAMAVVMMTMQELEKLGITQEGVDHHYETKAREDGKPIEALETAAEQIEFIANMGKGNEDQMFAHTLRDLGEMEKMMKTLLVDWRKGDRESMITSMIEPFQDYPQVYQSLLVERNQNWMPKIYDYLNSEDIEFILVGTAHLIGEDGVLQALEKLGYTVEQL